MIKTLENVSESALLFLIRLSSHKTCLRRKYSLEMSRLKIEAGWGIGVREYLLLGPHYAIRSHAEGFQTFPISTPTVFSQSGHIRAQKVRLNRDEV